VRLIALSSLIAVILAIVVLIETAGLSASHHRAGRRPVPHAERSQPWVGVTRPVS
jgi:hypothetical protein